MIELGEHKGDGIRYAMHLSAPKGGSAQMLRDPAGGWVSWEDYARLKALTSEMDKTINASQAECRRLKAEVERLTELNATISLRYDATKSMLDGCAKEIEEMEAEVERLQSIHSIDSIGIEQLKAEVERLTEALNKFTNTPNGVHGVEVKVSFWSKSGCRLPSSFSTFWMNAEKGQP